MSEKMLSPSDQDLVNACDLLVDLPAEYRQWFINGCRKECYGTNQKLPRISGKGGFPLQIVLEGCIGVWEDHIKANKDRKKACIESLIVSGQLVGEFEALGYASQNFILTTMMPTVVAIPNSSDFDRLVEELPSNHQKRFYKNLCNTFVRKIQFQNRLFQIRVEWEHHKRIIRLIQMFDEPGLSCLKSMVSESSFELKVIFSRSALYGLVDGIKRSTEPALGKLIRANALTLVATDREGNEVERFDAKRMQTTKSPAFEFMRLKVEDDRKLQDLLEGEN